jgi:cobalt-zinc-cadmium efflux system protein
MAHHHHHDHSRGYDHAGHSHATEDFGRAFAVGAALNSAFVVVASATPPIRWR